MHLGVLIITITIICNTAENVAELLRDIIVEYSSFQGSSAPDVPFRNDFVNGKLSKMKYDLRIHKDGVDVKETENNAEFIVIANNVDLDFHFYLDIQQNHMKFIEKHTDMDISIHGIGIEITVIFSGFDGVFNLKITNIKMAILNSKIRVHSPDHVAQVLADLLMPVFKMLFSGIVTNIYKTFIVDNLNAQFSSNEVKLSIDKNIAIKMKDSL